MLIRHVIGYLPSLIVPAVTSFAAVYGYTRLLSPDEYGHYALALTIMNLLNAVFFYWLQVSLPRLMPQAVRENKALQLRVTTYAAFIAVSMIMVILAVVFIRFIPLGNVYSVAWLAVALSVGRSCLTLNQAFHRAALDFKRYNLIECGQAILGLGIGLFLVYALHMGGSGAITGLILASLCLAAMDLRRWLDFSSRFISRDMLKDIIYFGLPLTCTYGLAFVISSSDRFLIDYFRGAGEVGIYAAGFTLVDRITAIVFMMVSLPSFPLTVHKLEHEGMEQARQQTYDNGIIALVLALPLLAGILVARPLLAEVVIGSQFRAGAWHVIPWIAFAACLNGLATHYFDHAFYLAKKPFMLFFTQGPAAALNLLLNLLLIPKFGYMGAAYASVTSYALLLILSICLGRKAFPMRFPFGPLLQIVSATLIMALILKQFTFSMTLAGLVNMAVSGILSYTAGLLLFDVMGSRRKLLKRFT